MAFGQTLTLGIYREDDPLHLLDAPLTAPPRSHETVTASRRNYASVYIVYGIEPATNSDTLYWCRTALFDSRSNAAARPGLIPGIVCRSRR